MTERHRKAGQGLSEGRGGGRGRPPSTRAGSVCICLTENHAAYDGLRQPTLFKNRKSKAPSAGTTLSLLKLAERQSSSYSGGQGTHAVPKVLASKPLLRVDSEKMTEVPLLTYLFLFLSFLNILGPPLIYQLESPGIYNLYFLGQM